jgi:hypothetical protein
LSLSESEKGGSPGRLFQACENDYFSELLIEVNLVLSLQQDQDNLQQMLNDQQFQQNQQQMITI